MKTFEELKQESVKEIEIIKSQIIQLKEIVNESIRDVQHTFVKR